jgi:NTP pyrophosphatase (non-canonical NTP hydrolase)
MYEGIGMKRPELYKESWELWGEEAQLKMLIEECAELIVAISKFGRLVNGNELDKIAEEIADVEICIEQVSQMKNLHTAIDAWKIQKLIRLEKILKAQKGI